jgi:hypothetical protein
MPPMFVFKFLQRACACVGAAVKQNGFAAGGGGDCLVRVWDVAAGGRQLTALSGHR